MLPRCNEQWCNGIELKKVWLTVCAATIVTEKFVTIVMFTKNLQNFNRRWIIYGSTTLVVKSEASSRVKVVEKFHFCLSGLAVRQILDSA
jgi:hypothetical protein